MVEESSPTNYKQARLPTDTYHWSKTSEVKWNFNNMGPLNLIIIGYFSSISLGIPCPVPPPPGQTNTPWGPQTPTDFNVDETGILLQAPRRNTSVSCALQLRHLPGLSPKLRLHCLPEAEPPPRNKPWLLAVRRPLLLHRRGDRGELLVLCNDWKRRRIYLSVCVCVSISGKSVFRICLPCGLSSCSRCKTRSHTHKCAHKGT